MAKKIAMTLKKIFENPIAKTIMDRTQKVDWQYLMDLWKPGLFNRKPAPAYNNEGELKGTDLDLHTFLSALVDRGAVINIPKYQSMRESVLKEGQMIVSKDNRHGKCTGLSSHKDVFSFGIRIKDANVMMTDEVGDSRVFNLMNITGEWHEGWHKLQFMPDAKENDFIKEYELNSDDKLVFTHFISPWRRHSIYSAPHFLTKMAINRIDDEAKYLSGLIQVMLKAGIKYPGEETEGAPKVWPKQTSVGDDKKVTVKSITYEVETPPISGIYPKIEMTQENLIAITSTKKWLVYTVKPILQYAIRGNEFANYKYINGNEFPHWIKGVAWKDEYKKPPIFTVNTNFIKKFKDDTINSVLLLMKDRSYRENELPLFYQEYSDLNNLFFNNSEVPEEIKEKVKATKGRVTFERLIMFQPDVGMYGVSLLRKTIDKTETVNKNYEE